MTSVQLAAIREAARQRAASWPPLTQDQLNRVALLLRESTPKRETVDRAA